MTVMAANVNEMLDTLEEEDYTAAVRYIEFLSVSRINKKNMESKKALKEMQALFSDDKGWDSEDDMLMDMAEFRRGRTNRSPKMMYDFLQSKS